MVKSTISSSTNDCQNFFFPIFITDKALWIINALKKSEFKKGMDRNARNHKNKEKRKSNVNSETKIVVLYIYRKTEHKTKWTTTPETKSPGIFSFKWITNSKTQKNYKKRTYWTRELVPISQPAGQWVGKQSNRREATKGENGAIEIVFRRIWLAVWKMQLRRLGHAWGHLIIFLFMAAFDAGSLRSHDLKWAFSLSCSRTIY